MYVRGVGNDSSVNAFVIFSNLGPIEFEWQRLRVLFPDLSGHVINPVRV